MATTNISNINKFIKHNRNAIQLNRQFERNKTQSVLKTSDRPVLAN